MNPSQPSPRRRTRKTTFATEALETRALLTGGAGNTFAIMQASIDKPDAKVVVPFVVNASLVSKPHGSLTLGIDVAKQSQSTAMPKIVALVDNVTHRTIPINHATYNPTVQRINPQMGSKTAAVLATIKLNTADLATGHSYSVTVAGMNHTTGGVLVGFYLPGDANGDGTVDNTDLQAIKKANGSIPGGANYLFAADANRDGRVNATDMRSAMQNIGATVKVSPVVSADLDTASDSGLADRITNIRTVHFSGAATPGAAITFDEASNKAASVSTTADALGHYSLYVTLGDGMNSFRVTSVDGFGQKISGLIAPVTYRVDAPTLGSSTTTTVQA